MHEHSLNRAQDHPHLTCDEACVSAARLDQTRALLPPDEETVVHLVRIFLKPTHPSVCVRILTVATISITPQGFNTYPASVSTTQEGPKQAKRRS